MDFSTTFYNPENDLDNEYLNEIHMHKIVNGRKSKIIVSGLQFKDKSDTDTFLTKISKMGVGATYKMASDFDKTNKVFIFAGDKRNEIKQILISDYGKKDEMIKFHG